MTRIIFAILLYIFGLTFSYSQNNQELSATEKLFVTAKIWGFLKYYHPNVANGALDWDKQLFDILPKVKNTNTKKEFSEVILHWLLAFGEVEKCTDCNNKEEKYLGKNFDLSWLQNLYYFDENVSSQLMSIKDNRFQGDAYYITPGRANTVTTNNEKVYKDFDYANENYRLLALFRYWNVIEHFYPYKYLTDQKWDDVLMEMIPKFQDVSNKTKYRLVLKELATKPDDTHSSVIFDDTTPRKYLVVKIKEIDEKAVVSGFFNDSIGKLSKFKLGDVILRVDGIDLENKMPEKLKYSPGSNINIRRRNAYYSLLKGEDSIADITVIRKSDTIQFKGKRYPYRDFYRFNRNPPYSSKWRIINESIGYMSMAHVDGKEAPKIIKNFMDMKAIIIDLRNYPQLIYHRITKYLNEDKKDFVKIFTADTSFPGRFKIVHNLQTGRKNRKSYQGKVILLVDDESFSRSEFTAMAFQTAKNAITVGSQTAGADGDVISFSLPDGAKANMTGVGYMYPDGTQSQRTGVKIDVEVHPTIESLREGRDIILEKAIELAEKNDGGS